MRTILTALILLPFLLVGCNTSGSNNVYEFNNSDLEKQIKDQEFQSKLPTVLPFKESDFEVSSPANQGNVITIDFFSEGTDNNENLSLMVVKGNLSSEGTEFEEVDIGKKKGKYGVNDAGSHILNWREGDVNYSLTYKGKKLSQDELKEALIETAKSFE